MLSGKFPVPYFREANSILLKEFNSFQRKVRILKRMLSDAAMYSEHRSMQIHDAAIFLRTIIKKMDWSRIDEDVVMDVGCGPGNSSCRMLLPAFPEVKKMIGVDVLPSMIKFAKKNNAHEKIEYHVADIEDRSTVEKWAGQISKIVSIYCFNWLGNQQEAFKNIYHILKPGGEAGLLFVLISSFWDMYPEQLENPKWSKYIKNVNPHVPESHYKKLGASHYKTLLEDIGFNIIICEDEKRTYCYPDDDDCRVACFSRSAFTSHIPDELKEDFKETLFQGFLKHSGRSSDGRPKLYYTALWLLIRKPKD